MSPDPQNPFQRDAIQPGDPPAANRPATPSGPGDFGSFQDSGPPKLGDLAQKAREKPLRHARIALIVVGVLTIFLNLFLLLNLGNEVKTELNKLQQGYAMTNQRLMNPREVETAMYAAGYVIYGGTVVLGAIFIVLGCMVMKYPMVSTVTGLALYILGNVALAVLVAAGGDKEALVRVLASGLIMKIIIIVVLINAVKAAGVYEREKRRALEYDTGM